MFRLLTANLLHDLCDAGDFARLVERLDPDVIVTQELGPFCADVVAGAYPNHRLRPALDFTGRGMATRFEARFGDIEMPGRMGTSAVLDVDGRPVRVAGVHLLNPVVFPWWRSARGRGRQLGGLFSWLDDDSSTPTVVAGDFNASPSWPVYRKTAARLTDLVEQWASGAGTNAAPTWGWRPGWPRLLRIDHVFGSGVRAREVGVHPVEGSDHASLVVDLEIVD